MRGDATQSRARCSTCRCPTPVSSARCPRPNSLLWLKTAGKINLIVRDRHTNETMPLSGNIKFHEARLSPNSELAGGGGLDEGGGGGGQRMSTGATRAACVCCRHLQRLSFAVILIVHVSNEVA